MHSVAKELRTLSRALAWKGGLMVVLGSSAIIWPEETLIAAMIVVGALSTLFGLYEAALAISIRRRTPRWWLVLAHGVASVAFGLLTVGVPGLSLHVAVYAAAGWMGLYAGIAWSAASMAKNLPSIRRALIIWGALDVSLAVVGLAFPAVTIFWWLFFGAVYALAFGAWQLVAGLWLGRLLHSHLGRVYDGVIIPAHS